MPRSLPSALGVPTWPRLRLSRRLIRYSSVKCPVPWWSRQRDAAAFEAEPRTASQSGPRRMRGCEEHNSPSNSTALITRACTGMAVYADRLAERRYDLILAAPHKQNVG